MIYFMLFSSLVFNIVIALFHKKLKNEHQDLTREIENINSIKSDGNSEELVKVYFNNNNEVEITFSELRAVYYCTYDSDVSDWYSVKTHSKMDWGISKEINRFRRASKYQKKKTVYFNKKDVREDLWE